MARPGGISIFFDRQPGEHVVVRAFGLDYRGRVSRCCWGRDGESYEVDYAKDGDLKVGAFRSDELGDAPCETS